MPYTYEYPHPAVTVDGVVFGFDDADLKVLVIQRGATGSGHSDRYLVFTSPV